MTSVGLQSTVDYGVQQRQRLLMHIPANAGDNKLLGSAQLASK